MGFRGEQDEESYQEEQGGLVENLPKHDPVLSPRSGDSGTGSTEFVFEEFDYALRFFVEDLLTANPMINCMTRFMDESGSSDEIRKRAVRIEKKLMVLFLRLGWGVYEVGKDYVFTAKHRDNKDNPPNREYILYRGSREGFAKALIERLLSHLEDLPERADAKAKFPPEFFAEIARIREAMRSRLGL